jgi:hypothetical protein
VCVGGGGREETAVRLLEVLLMWKGFVIINWFRLIAVRGEERGDKKRLRVLKETGLILSMSGCVLLWQ